MRSLRLLYRDGPAHREQLPKAQLNSRADEPHARSGGIHEGESTASAPLAAPEFSDDYLALEFAARAQEFRWSPGLEWMYYNGVVWGRDHKLHRYERARAICREVATEARGEEAKRLASARCVSAVIGLARSDKRLVVPAQEWDSLPLDLNTPAGLVDLRTGKLRARTGEYVTRVTKVAPVCAPAPTWDRFLQEVFCGDKELIAFVRRALGYCLTGDRREQVLFFWYGKGANGKSVLADFIQWMLGDYAIKLPSTVLMQSRGERHPTELAQLQGKRLAVSSELDESSHFNEALVKELTGDSTLSARFMRGDFFEFSMSQKHIIVGNSKPRLHGDDAALSRRCLLVPFNAVFSGAKRDHLMQEKLRGEAPAILHSLCQGAAEWAAEGLGVPAVIQDASAEYMAENNDLEAWLQECCVQEGHAKASDLYRSFADWKRARGEVAPSLTAWGSRLSAMQGIEKYKSDGVRYRGVRPKQ